MSAFDKEIQQLKDRATELFGPVIDEGDVGEALKRLKETLHESDYVSINWAPEWDHFMVRVEGYYSDKYDRKGEGRTICSAIERVLNDA